MAHALRLLMERLHRAVQDESSAPKPEELVYAVSRCHPTRVAVYAAAFQGGWTVEFVPNLREVLALAKVRPPKAVFYDHTNGGRAWDEACSELSRMGIPFILLAHKPQDETFLVLLARGGFHAWGTPLASEQILKAVELAEEVGELAGVRS